MNDSYIPLVQALAAVFRKDCPSEWSDRLEAAKAALVSADKSVREARIKFKSLQHKIKSLSAEIKAASLADKKALGHEIKKLQEELEKLKPQTQGQRNGFIELDYETKACALTERLMSFVLSRQVLEEHDIGCRVEDGLWVDGEALADKLKGKLGLVYDYVLEKAKDYDGRTFAPAQIFDFVKSDAGRFLDMKINSNGDIDLELLVDLHQALNKHKADVLAQKQG